MTTISTVIVLGVLSAVGFTAASVLPVADGVEFPWKDLSGGGAAVLLLVALFVFLRHLRDERASSDAERKANREHVEKVVGDCTTMTHKLGETFSTTQLQMMQAVREDSHTARRELTEALRDITRKPA
jgi:hypothetical protein